VNKDYLKVVNFILGKTEREKMAVVNPSKQISALNDVVTLAEIDQWHTQNNKTTCEYCQGTTPDDSRGNCVACGAPREQEKEENTFEQWAEDIEATEPTSWTAASSVSNITNHFVVRNIGGSSLKNVW